MEYRGYERADALVDALKSGVDYEEYLDVDEVLRHFACLAVWGADSTILTGMNNFFLYDTGDKFILIPWDSSEAFAAYYSGNGIDRFQRERTQEDSVSPLFMLLMENETYKKAYHDYIRQINDDFLSPDRMDAHFNALATVVRPYLDRDCTMLLNRPYELPVVPADEFGTVNALLETLYQIHDNLSAQLAGKTDEFYYSLAYAQLQGDDMNAQISYMVQVSPRLNPDITEKICDAYSSWYRTKGQIPFDADDPVEIAVAAAAFAAVFISLVIRMRGKPKRQKTQM